MIAATNVIVSLLRYFIALGLYFPIQVSSYQKACHRRLNFSDYSTQLNSH